MCGIAGIVHLDRERPVNHFLLKKMTDTLIHRGPDGSGLHIEGNVGLGHRRLSIIDLSTGDQPQFNDDQSIAIVFNGEIYNYLELRDELRKLGYCFRTNSDTEVIIRAYEHWGVDCQQKLNGMWAFALWDSRERKLFLSRDRLGEKPLYYSLVDNTLLFGSEIKAILAYGYPYIADTRITELYLSLSYIPAPYSFYKNIYKLPAGNYLLVEGSRMKSTAYWDVPSIVEDELINDPQLVYQEFTRLFHDSVKIRMRSDVPFGAFLSGGLDSASVVAAMTKSSREPVHTFTIGFDDAAFDERSLAADVALKFSTNHNEYVVKPDTLEESVTNVLKYFDEPFGDSSAIPTGYVSKLASKHVRMVLTGDGGDELLSGYNSYQIEKFAEWYQRLPSIVLQLLPKFFGSIKKISKGPIRYQFNRAERILQYSSLSYESRLIIKSSWCPHQYVKPLTKNLGDQISLNDFIYDFYSRYKAHDPFYKLMLFHMKVQLPDDFLVKVDRMSMAYSLETRIPFLDYRLVELMMRVSKSIKMNGLQRKSILRKTIGKELPGTLLKASKKGFTPPVREWFKDPAFIAQMDHWFTDGFLDRNIVRLISEQNYQGKADWGNLIWILYVLNSWNNTKN